MKFFTLKPHCMVMFHSIQVLIVTADRAKLPLLVEKMKLLMSQEVRKLNVELIEQMS